MRSNRHLVINADSPEQQRVGMQKEERLQPWQGQRFLNWLASRSAEPICYDEVSQNEQAYLIR